MMRRLATVLLATALACAGQTASACPQRHCAMARAMTCCQHGGLSRPSCCPPVDGGRLRATLAAADRPGDAVLHLASHPSSLVVALAIRSALAGPRPIHRPAAPPGTLLGQRTSLVL